MKVIYHILLVFVALTLWCCQDDRASLNQVGYLRLSVTESGQLNTRAYDPKIMHVEILSEDSAIVKQTDDLDEWEGEVFELPVGAYRIIAYSNDYKGQPAFNSPYYYGDTTVQVKAATETKAKVDCKIANVKVTVNYSEDFKTAFAGRDIFVTVGSAEEKPSFSSMTFKYGSDAALYLPSDCGPLKATLNVSKSDGSEEYYTLSETKRLAEPKANDHFILNYQMGDTNKGDFTVTVDPTTNSYSYTFYINMTPLKVSAKYETVNAWATFAYLEASNVEADGEVNPTTVKFNYRKKGEQEWQEIATAEFEGTYTARPTNLEDNTAYEYCLAINGVQANMGPEFTTEEATPLYNGSFDNWYQNGDIWYAITQGDATSFDNSESKFLNSFWDSGNPGAAMIGADSQPTMPVKDTEAYGGKGQSAKLTSMYKGFGSMGKFAAGNIYTGHYCETIMEILAKKFGARLRFGHEFTSRPTQLKGVYKYSRGTTIDYGSDEYKSKLESTGGDLCSVYIALTDNEGLKDNASMEPAAFEIDNDLTADEPENFKYKSTIDFSEKNPHIIAYGELSENEAKGAADWTPFTIDLKYRDLTRKPKYIIVVASASKYGDFFTGSTKSVMYIDNFELVYDGEPKKEE